MAIEANVTALHAPSPTASGDKVVLKVLLAISFCHLLNDTVQSLLPAIYPILRDSFHLDFGQVGLIALTLQVTASLLQPLVGLYSDHRHHTYLLAAGMSVTLIGLLILSMAPGYGTVLLAAGLVGVGSAVFHPESSRVARMASGGQHGMAQSLFQVGGNAGSALGPLLAAFILPRGQTSIAWFSLMALAGMVLLSQIGLWTTRVRSLRAASVSVVAGAHTVAREARQRLSLTRGKIIFSLFILMMLMFSKYFYLASISSYYTFYLMGKFHVSIQSAQIHLFIFLGAVAAGTIVGGPVGDRMGRKVVMWYSILGVLPFTLMLPYANLFWTTVLSIVIGLILSSAFSAILVYAQELVPGKVGTISGLFFGFAFGMGGVGAAFLGKLADWTSINFVYHVCSFLPALGILTAFLPNVIPEPRKASA